MKPDEHGERPFDYPQNGVAGSIPTQASGRRVKPELNDLVWEPGMKEQPNFMPYRLVINLEFHDEDTGEMLKDFKPPIKFRVNYTAEDKETAKGKGKPLRIAYWKNNQWKIITEKSHKLADDRSSAGRGVAGVFRFEIETWGEPSIGLGE